MNRRRTALGWVPGLAAALAILTGLVVLGTPVVDLDAFLAVTLVVPMTDPARPLVELVTDLGGWQVRYPVMVIASLILLGTGRRWMLGPQWGGFVVSQLVTQALKYLIGRERPLIDAAGNLLVDENTRSFPSGHATSAVFVYGFLAFLAMSSRLPPPLKWTGTVFFSLTALAVSASRVLLGVHFASDVIGGIISGGLGLALSLAFIDGGKWRPEKAYSGAVAEADRRR